MLNKLGNIRNSTAPRPNKARARASTPLIQPVPKARSASGDFQIGAQFLPQFRPWSDNP